MRTAIILSQLLLLAPIQAASQEHYESRIARLEHQVQLLSKQVHWLQRQIEQDREFQANGEHMYQCELTAFGNAYIGRSSSRGRAMTKAVEDCNKSQNAMFCRPENIKCVKY